MPAPGPAPPGQPPAIEAIGLSRYYGPFAAVHGLSFSIPSGQVVALLGPNGAGKSTTMRMLMGLLAPSRGTARLRGHDIGTHRREATASAGYLPENGPLYPDMTPAQLLSFFGRARGMEPDVLADRMDAVTAECSIGEIRHKPIGKLSKGLRQRVGLAQALLHDPDVLILDEPTAGLDPNQIRDVRDLIGRLRTRKTLLISTHMLHEADATADRVLLVHEGRLAFDGTPTDMRRDGTIEECFLRLTAPSARAAS